MRSIAFSAFRRAVRRATATVAGERPLGRLLGVAAGLLGRNPAALARVRSDAAALVRMAREALSGHYRTVPKRTLIAALAAVIYLVDPIDLIPDVLPMLGLLDDAVILAWVVRQIRRDIDEFLAWEKDWGGAIDVDGEAAALPIESLPVSGGPSRA